MASDGAGPRPLIEKARSASWLPDGRRIVHVSTVDHYLYLYDLETRRGRRVTEEPTQAPLSTVSPDGKWLVYQSSAAADISIRARPIDGGETRVVIATPNRANYHPMVSTSGNWLYYQVDHKNIYRLPGPSQGWRKAEPQKITDFPESGLFIEDPLLSRDGKQLLYSRGKITGDLWLLRLPKREATAVVGPRRGKTVVCPRFQAPAAASVRLPRVARKTPIRIRAPPPSVRAGSRSWRKSAPSTTAMTVSTSGIVLTTEIGTRLMSQKRPTNVTDVPSTAR